MAGIAAAGALTARASATPAGATAGAPARAPAWELALATPDDDAALRALLRRSVIPGAVRIAFTREPHYGAGDALAGAEEVTLVARRAGAVVAMGRCSVHTLHRNGQLQRVGYLGELRVLPGTPSTARLLRDGYALLAESVAARQVDGVVTSIATDNAHARRILERGQRFGLPAYRPFAPLVTLVMPVPARARGGPSPGPAHASTVPADALTAFLQRHAIAGQLTLSWDAARWAALAAHGITPASFAVVEREGHVAAAAAVWDQRPFRQTVIDGYGGALRVVRPWLNVVQRLRGAPPLPPPGAVLAQGAVLGATVPDPRDWPALWRALERHAAARGVAWLAITRGANDPQLPALRALRRARTYHTTLYDVAWRDRRSWGAPWDARPVRPEVGLL